MVEQVRVNPEEVRGYGNICAEHSLEDFIISSSGLAKEKENVHGALTNVYKLVYSLYGLIFSFDKGNKQLYLHSDNDAVVGFSFSEKSLVFNTVSHISFDFADKNLVVDDEHYLFVDYGVTGKKNTNWQNYSSRLTVTVDDEGTNLVKGSSNGYYLVNNASNDFEDYICEFDIVETSGYVNWYVQSSSNQVVFTFSTYQLVSGTHVKIHSEDGVLNVYVDGVKKTNDITITPPAPYQIGFRIPSGNTLSNLKYKNFKVYDV